MSAKTNRLWLWLHIFLFVFGGGVLGFISTWIFAFVFYGVPSTMCGVQGVFFGVEPVGVLSGCVVGVLVGYHMKKRKQRDVKSVV
jgi:membrane associated rhomboid family serine protease